MISLQSHSPILDITTMPFEMNWSSTKPWFEIEVFDMRWKGARKSTTYISHTHYIYIYVNVCIFIYIYIYIVGLNHKYIYIYGILFLVFYMEDLFCFHLKNHRLSTGGASMVPWLWSHYQRWPHRCRGACRWMAGSTSSRQISLWTFQKLEIYRRKYETNQI